MTKITAWQHIYSNVEKDRSPQGRGGFQTLFYTHAGLTEEEVEEMESYLLYFPSEVEPVKRLFFTLSTGKGVVAQIVFLPDPDQYGRGGRYLAHSLIFAPEALADFDTNPFRVFRRFTFVRTVEEALAQGNFEIGDIPAVSLDLPHSLSGEIAAARAWPRSELKKLSLLALHAEQQAHNRQAITFIGEPKQIEPAVEAAFLAVPRSLRSHCTFDTYFYRCNLVATYFWATGLPEPPASIKFAQVDSALRRIQGQAPEQPNTAYERWVTQTIDADRLDEVARYRDNAFALGRWLDGQVYDETHLIAVPETLISSVFAVNASAIQNLLRSKVQQTLPESLVEKAAAQLYQQSSPLQLYRRLRQGFDLPIVLDALYEHYAARKFAKPSRKESKALETVLQSESHPMLNLILAYWTDPRKQLPRGLKKTDEANYRRFAELALQLDLLEPATLILPGRADIFLDAYLAVGGSDVVDVVEALIEAKETTSLLRLSGKVATCSGKELRKLANLIDDEVDIPPSFRQTVEQALTAQPEGAGIKGLFRTILRRSGDE